MTYASKIWIAGVFTGACALQAQTPAADAKAAFNGIRNNMVKMAEKMPEDQYGFKATPDVRTFGQLVGHVADSTARTCSSVQGEAKNVGASQKTAKADLVAALKEAMGMCDAAFGGLTDENAKQTVKTARGERSRLGALNQVIAHNNEEYGYMAVYMRLKGIVPPSSEGR